MGGLLMDNGGKRRLTGRVAYPTVVINGEAIAGFSKSWIDARIGG